MGCTTDPPRPIDKTTILLDQQYKKQRARKRSARLHQAELGRSPLPIHLIACPPHVVPSEPAHLRSSAALAGANSIPGMEQVICLYRL